MGAPTLSKEPGLESLEGTVSLTLPCGTSRLAAVLSGGHSYRPSLLHRSSTSGPMARRWQSVHRSWQIRQMPSPLPPAKVEQFAILVRASLKTSRWRVFWSHYTDGGFTKMSLRVTERSLRSRIKSTKWP